MAILDSGFRGYRDHLGKSLPRHVTVRSFRTDRNLEAKDSQHGILCGEVVHALAPDADLLFANWESDSPDRFLDAVSWARKEGARVISCSVIMPSWSDGEGHGRIHDALSDILGRGDLASDVLCFASAGNVAQRAWGGRFRDHGDGYHEWTSGETDNALTPWAGESRVSIELCWSGGCDYEVSVVDRDSGSLVSASRVKSGSAGGCAVARFRPEEGHSYSVRLCLVRGAAAPFHLVALGSGLATSTARGSVCFPADGAEVFAVGAVDREGHRQLYSACGPNSCEPKPDLVAPVPFPSLWRERPFAGTSAAAPQAAAVCALLRASHPGWSASQVRKALQASAIDLGPRGHDFETGFGMVHLPRLLPQNVVGAQK